MRKDGSRFLADVVIDALKDDAGRLIGFAKITRDVTERVQAAQARIGLVQSRAEALRRVQAERAHVARVTTLGELTASIAHELNQPIGSTLLDAQAALHWLAAQPPDLDEVRQSLANIIAAAKRAGDITGRYRDLKKKTPYRADRLDINYAIREVVELTRPEAIKNDVLVQMELADGLPHVKGDKVELQQFVLNLIMNAVEAMSAVAKGARELVISTTRADADMMVTVRDSGPRIDLEHIESVFDAFYTTKSRAMRKMNARSLPELGRMVDKLKLAPEKTEHS